MQIVLSCNEYLNNFYVNEKDQITHVGNGLWISYEFLVLFSINSERKSQMNFKKHFPYYIYGKSYHKEKYEYLNFLNNINDNKSIVLSYFKNYFYIYIDNFQLYLFKDKNIFVIDIKNKILKEKNFFNNKQVKNIYYDYNNINLQIEVNEFINFNFNDDKIENIKKIIVVDENEQLLKKILLSFLVKNYLFLNLI